MAPAWVAPAEWAVTTAALAVAVPVAMTEEAAVAVADTVS